MGIEKILLKKFISTICRRSVVVGEVASHESSTQRRRLTMRDFLMNALIWRDDEGVSFCSCIRETLTNVLARTRETVF